MLMPFAPVLLSLSLVSPAFASSYPAVEQHILTAIRAIWAMDFDGSEQSLSQAENLLPGYPYTSFGRANVTWLRYVYGSQQTDESLKRKFEREVEEAVTAGQTWLKSHPEDAAGYLALSGSYGLRSRLSTIQKRWLRALWDGRKAVKLTRKAHSLDPHLHDALLGTGMYDYYADSLPRSVRILSRLFLGGSRERGIESLKTVAKKGRFAKIAAQLLLIEIYTEDDWGAKDPEESVRIIGALRKEFPKSPVFHQVEHVCLYEAGRYKELLESAWEYQHRIDDRWPYYPSKDSARMFVTVGTAYFAENKLETAREAFESAAKLAGTQGKPERWGVWGLVRLGQVRDALKNREEAKASYRAAADFSDVWGFRKVAQQGLREPILFGKGIGQLPPP